MTRPPTSPKRPSSIEPHRELVRILAQIAVDQYLREVEMIDENDREEMVR